MTLSELQRDINEHEKIMFLSSYINQVLNKLIKMLEEDPGPLVLDAVSISSLMDQEFDSLIKEMKK